jgi:hypothetical protein
MHVIVIGEPGRLRSKNLETLKLVGYEIEYMEPHLPKSDDRGLVEDRRFQKALLGRVLNKGEVGCWMAHHLARISIATRRCHEFHIVLEDDADCRYLPDAGELLRIAERSISTKRPALTSLFMRMPPTGSGKPSIKRVLVPNAGTVGYLLNSKAAELDLRFDEVRTTADWPSQFHSCRFFESSNFGVLEWPGQSTIGGRVKDESAIRFYLNTILRIQASVREGVSVREALWAAFIAPLLRDMRNRFRRINQSG